METMDATTARMKFTKATKKDSVKTILKISLFFVPKDRKMPISLLDERIVPKTK